MKINLVGISVATCVVLFGSQQGYSQGTFVNLDFESVIRPLIPDINSRVPITNALPGWTAYLNGIPRDQVLFNEISLGGPSVSLLDSLSPFSNLRPIQGDFCAYLSAGAISQTGRIPNDASSLFFLSVPGSVFLVSFGGQNIPVVQFGTIGNNIIMAGDISSFAGQTGQLVFASGGGLVDAIQFSPQTIPEPGTFCLFGLGALLLGWRFLYKRP